MAVMAGLLSVPMVTAVDREIPAPVRRSDPQADTRLLKLQKFFRNCPLRDASVDFIEAADRYDLDWRLLPSISLIESGGGRAFKNNNVLGWDSGNRRFGSVRAGIHAVAARIATSVLYRDKGLDEVLATYNPDPAYAARVKSVMQEIGSPAAGPETRLN
jgi:hypothetical protein